MSLNDEARPALPMPEPRPDGVTPEELALGHHAGAAQRNAEVPGRAQGENGGAQGDKVTRMSLTRSRADKRA